MRNALMALTPLVLIAFAGCGSPQTVGQAEVEVPVSVEEIARKPIEEFVVATGTVNATRDAMLRSEASGFYRLAVNPATGREYRPG